MPVIITGPAATRLAKAIVADLTVYTLPKLEGGADVTDEVEEGRKLFQARVDSAERHVYEDALRESPFRAYALGANAEGANAVPLQPRVRVSELSSTPPKAAGSGPLIWLLLLVGLGLSIAGYLYFRARGVSSSQSGVGTELVWVSVSPSLSRVGVVVA